METYELVAVFDGGITPAKRKAFGEKLSKMVSALEGEIKETLDWGVKPFAYPIKKAMSGAYVIYTLQLTGKGAKDIFAKLNHETELVRHLLVRKDEKPVRIKRSGRAEAEPETKK